MNLYMEEEYVSIRKKDIERYEVSSDGTVKIEAKIYQYDYKRDIKNKKTKHQLPKKYILSNEATVLIWSDGTKTIVKCSKDDKCDKEKGFLIAFFQRVCGMSKTQANNYLKKIGEEKSIIKNGNKKCKGGKKDEII